MAGPMAIITACAYEAALVRRCLHVQQQMTGDVGRLWQGTLCGQEVVLLQSGMGPARATPAVLWLAQRYQLAGVLSVGFAGALQADLAQGEALLVTSVLAPCLPPPEMGASWDRDAEAGERRAPRVPQARSIQPDARLAHIAAMAVAQAAVVSCTGTLLSTSSVIAQAAAKSDTGRLSGALAVDMESYSIGLVALQHHLPFVVLRTIFDSVAQQVALPITTCMTPHGSLQPWRLMGCLARHPGLWLHLPSWWWSAHIAGRHLQRWLQHFFLLLRQGAWYNKELRTEC